MLAETIMAVSQHPLIIFMGQFTMCLLSMRSLEQVSVFLEACFRIRSTKARVQDCSMMQ